MALDLALAATFARSDRAEFVVEIVANTTIAEIMHSLRVNIRTHPSTMLGWLHVTILATARLPTALVVAAAPVIFPATGRVALADLDLSTAIGLISLLSDRVDETVLARAPHLRFVANYAVGTDNIDLDAATALGICVLNTPDVLTDATAEFAFALMLAVARRLGQGERLVRAGLWQGWAPDLLLGQPVAGRRLGIIGMGRIGRAMAQRAAAFGMQVSYVGGRPGPGLDACVRAAATLDELFATSDVISLHCPLNTTSRHVVNATRLGLMPAGGIIINTARGDCIDEAALLAAIDRGHLFGAGLDVFTGEPALNPALLQRENVICTPHLGSGTSQARAAMVHCLEFGIAHVLSAQMPLNLVNPAVWPRRRSSLV